MGKKAAASAAGIYQNKIFDEIIAMNNSEKFDSLLEKILLLIKALNVPADNDNYRFENVEVRDKRITKLNEKVADITVKTVKVL